MTSNEAEAGLPEIPGRYPEDASGTRIGVAFSGGVDSAVSVRLLQEQGYAVEAWHMLTCTDEAEPRVYEVAEALGVPLHVLDLREVFERDVVSPFYAGYARGETPNPCLFCNPRLKFGVLRRAIGGLMATGHYVRRGIDADTGLPALFKAPDPKKDQSYFLCQLSSDAIRDVRFPVSSFSRAQVVALARAWHLPIPESKLSSGSQDICFLPDGDYRPELCRRFPETAAPGDVLNPDGNVIGRHTGLANYTRGQRKGLGVATGSRAFVVNFDRSRNTLTLGPKEMLEISEFPVHSIVWQIPPSAFPFRCEAVTRYHHRPFACTVSDTGLVTAEMPQTLVTPGQACAFYRNETLLGGGIIGHSV